jgi:hypothetical protein
MAQAAHVSPISRPRRQASPERWQRAVERAVAEHIEVRQINSNGMWTASSGTDPKVAYVLEIVAGVVRSCSCPAGAYGDPCCKHAARYYLDAGLLDPEPEPPAPAVAQCFHCSGCGIQQYRGGYALPCPTCAGTGRAPLVAQAEALRAAAEAFDPSAVCDHCGEPVGDEAVTDDALQTLCEACVADRRQEAREAVAAAIAEAHAQDRWKRVQLAA